MCVEATLIIRVDVECPKCEHDFDLTETSANDDGYIYKQLLPDDRWEIEEPERLECDNVTCPECGHVFDVKGVIW